MGGIALIGADRQGAGRHRLRQNRRQIGSGLLPKRGIEVAGYGAARQFEVGEGIGQRAIIRVARHDNGDRDKRPRKQRHHGRYRAPNPNFKTGNT